MIVHTLAALAVRVTGIVLCLYVIAAEAWPLYVASQVNASQWNGPGNWRVVALISAALLGTAAICMVVLPGWVAARLTPRQVAASEMLDTSPTLEGLETLGCFLLGLCFLALAVADAAWLIGWQYALASLDLEPSWTPESFSTVSTAIAKCLAAVWFFTGARGLGKFRGHKT